MTRPSVFTIAPDRPFVDVLAKTLLAQAGDDPMVLAQMRVLLPTRRAIRALREAFLRLSEGKPLLLPQMQPVGDVDEEEMLLSGLLTGGEGADSLPPVMPSSRRVLLLAGLIWHYHRLEYGPHSRMDQAVQLAKELTTLLDEVAREELDITALADIVPLDLAEHWKLTLDFLHIIIAQWPQILAEEGRLDPITRRNRMLHMLAAHWRAHPPAYPVIAAGTTGSTPATAQLLAVIKDLPQGMVVLPGWDSGMDDATWDALDPEGKDYAQIAQQQTHPQYGMRHLLASMELARADVQELGGQDKDSARVQLLKAALLPAELTDSWRHYALDWQQAIAGCSRIDCATVQEEATTIALLLRDAVEQAGKTAALITPNRDLARRVSAVLRRFHVTIDDSAGVPLADTPAGVLLRLLLDVAINRAAPVPLLSLLKHPLALAGLPLGQCRHLARELERYALRGVRLAEGMEAIIVQVQADDEIDDKTKDNLVIFAERIASNLSPLMELMQAREVRLQEAIRTHIAVAETLSTDAAGAVTLWQGEEGEQLAAFLHELLASAEGMRPIDAQSYPGMLAAMLAGQVWRPQYGMHPRLQILSPMEARLQLFDRVVLGGLNEGGWPQDAGQDPWMSRPMRSGFGLPLPERQTGLSAHDFVGLASAKEVFLTRAEKEGGSPSVPSRWLLRIEAMLGVLAGEEARHAWLAEGATWRHWAVELDAMRYPEPCPEPMPRPPVAARPRELYVTRVETLLRNPYGIYAGKILRLNKLEPLDEDPGAREFGTVVHDAIEQYIKSGKQGIDVLKECGEQAFAELLRRPAIRAFWWPRFCRIAEWFVAEEQARKPDLRAVEAEQQGEVVLQAPAGDFALKARLDRLETLRDGGLRLIDYKTGTPPTAGEVERGIAAQLLLEAVIAQEGTIGEASRRSAAVVDLEYWHLKGGREAAVVTSMADKAAKKDGLEVWIGRARDGVAELIAAYDDPATPYRYAPVAADKPRYDDYEHLARVKEWGAEG